MPRLTSISVNQGPATGGTTVTITGTGFTGATAVSFGASAAASFTVSGNQTITAVSPAANGGTVDITVTTAGGTNALSASDQFTFVPAPVVSSLSPNSGPVAGGGYVTITGANLTYVTGVTFGDQATSFIVNSDTSISAYVPPSDSGVDSTSASVSSIGGTSAGVQYDYVNVIPPAVTGAKPDVGPISGGQTVTITGSGFDPSTTVQFGSTPAERGVRLEHEAHGDRSGGLRRHR